MLYSKLLLILTVTFQIQLDIIFCFDQMRRNEQLDYGYISCNVCIGKEFIDTFNWF